MATKDLQALVIEQRILNRIYVVRGEKVMLDRDLAEMYGVETKRLKEAVKRNIERFPKDFMFEMTTGEFKKRIIRVFVKMREYAFTHKEILLQFSKLEKEVKSNSKDIENIFLVLKELIEKQSKPAPPRRRIGFINSEDNR